MPTKKAKADEPYAVYLLKILLYFILGTIWIRHSGTTVFPLGLVLGILFSTHDHFRIDRKIEYAILLVASMLAFFGPGIFINL